MTRADRLWLIIAIFACIGAWALGARLKTSEMSWTGLLLIGAGIVMVLLPPSFDPAIRWREWLERKRR